MKNICLQIYFIELLEGFLLIATINLRFWERTLPSSEKSKQEWTKTSFSSTIRNESGNNSFRTMSHHSSCQKRTSTISKYIFNLTWNTHPAHHCTTPEMTHEASWPNMRSTCPMHVSKTDSLQHQLSYQFPHNAWLKILSFLMLKPPITE